MSAPDSMCRACMRADGVLVPMYGDTKLSRKNLPEKLAELTSINVNMNDGLPTMLCVKCAYRTDALYEFKIKVQESEKRLRTMFGKQSYPKIKEEEIFIAKEEQVEYLDTNDIEECPVPNTKHTARLKVADMGLWSATDNVETTEKKVQTVDIVEATEPNARPNQRLVVLDINHWSAAFLTGDIIDGEDSESEDKRNSNENEDLADSEDAESESGLADRFNLLGSVNDAIIKIREVKIDDVMTFQCTLCQQNYDRLTDALFHTIDNHVPESGPFFCMVCEKDCSSHRHLRNHVKKHSGPFPYTCFLCKKAYSLKRYLKRHMACHADFPRHRCPKCGLRFKTKAEMETHGQMHIQSSSYECSQCPRVFNHKGNYKRHLMTHLDPHGLHLPKFPCKTCGKRFVNNRMLTTHNRVHTGERPFKCEICQKTFTQKGNLFNHSRIHSNPRSYTCEVCGKRFNQRATLRDHSKLHTGEKPYICNVCGAAFTFGAALRRHMWAHAGGKPYGCEVCDARFVGKYDLKRHMSVHSNRPRVRRKRNQTRHEEFSVEEPRDNVPEVEEPTDYETVLVEEVLLNEDVTQVVTPEESEKENVDALFNLIQYGG